jgi:hypothetical protein
VAALASVAWVAVVGFVWVLFPGYLRFYLLALAVGLTVIWRPTRA